MKFLKKYGPPAAALLMIWLAKQLWGEKGEQAAVILGIIGAVAICIIVMCHSRKKYRYCPKCGCGTELGWHTEKTNAKKKWVRVGDEWQYGGFVSQKTAIIRCPGCGWEINLGK